LFIFIGPKILGMLDLQENHLNNLTIEELRVLARIPTENPNPILQIGYDGTLLYGNRSFFNLSCFHHEIIGSEVSPSLRDPVMEAISAGHAMDFEIQDNDHIFLFSVMPVEDTRSVFLYGRDITSRKKSERELVQMALIARETGNGVIITDPNGRVQWVNQSFEKFTGYLLEDVIGTIPGEILQGPETDQESVKKISIAIKNQQPIEQDILNYSKSGTPYWIRLQIQPVFDNVGKLLNFISIQHNITSEKFLQEEIKDNEQKLRLILESALDGVIIIDEGSRVLTWTSQSESIFGFTAEEVIGKPLGSFIVPERLREAHQNGIRRFLATGVPRILNQRIEITGLRKSGEEFPVELTIIPIRSKGTIIFCAFTRDISSQKEALSNLESTTSRLSALISNLNAGVLVEDEHRNIALINHQFCTMFGIPVGPEVLVGTDCSQSAEQTKDMFTDPARFVSRIDELLILQEISLNEEVTLRDGRTFERDYIPIFSGGAFLGNLWQYRDISQRKRDEQVLKASRLVAEDANRAKSSFLANMSHEIRTPMNAVHGIVRLLTGAPHLPEQEDLHQRLIASSESLLSIINDILDFSKIEAGLLTLENTPFILSDIFKRVNSSMEVKATQKSLALIQSLDNRVAPVLDGDPVRLGQILLNLVSNAIKFTEKGHVEVACKLVIEDEHTNTIDFSVTDTGIGIDESKRAKIFESYQQEDDSTTRQFGGTGLGLSISKQLVELMGGELTVESEKNKGSRFGFTLTLNRSLNNSFTSRNREITIDPEKLRGKRVLIVEDNEMNQFVAKGILSKWNMEIFQVRNGQKAIDFLLHNECDIVLMDKQMPVMGGVEATRYIREILKSSIPIVALTADAVIEMVEECLAAGMNDYVTKPFEPWLLYSKMVDLLQ